MRQPRQMLSYANVMATLAFFLALTGGAYAVAKLPRNSVGPKQLKRAAVTNTKVKKGSLNADRLSNRARTSLKGNVGPKGDTGAPSAPGLVRAYAHVLSSGQIDPARASKGFVSGRTTPTYFCLKLDPSIDASTATPIVSNEWPNGFVFSGSVAIGIAQPFMGGICDQGNEIGVATASWQTGAADSYGIGPYPFFIAVP